MSHKKTWECTKPGGDGCDGDHEHDTKSEGKCWCNPTLTYIDPVTGVKCWTHKSDEELNQ
jgi:hypothetical protein